MNSVNIVLDGKRTTKAFDPTTTVSDVLAYAASQLAANSSSSKHAFDRSGYGAYVYGQRVDLTETLGPLKCSELVFVKLEDKVATGSSAAHATSSPTAPKPALVTIPRYGEMIRRRAWARVERHLASRGRPPQPSAEVGAAGSAAIASDELAFSEVAYPIAVGSVVQWLGPAAPGDQTHQWTVYVRGHKNEDLTSIVEAIEFRLHDTFKQPLRRLESPPFEVSEKGWGQFTVAITVCLRHVEGPGKKIAMSHFIAFSPPAAPPAVRSKSHCVPPLGAPFAKASDAIPPFALVKAPVVTETADELVVRNPTVAVRDAFTALLASTAAAPAAARGSGSVGGVTVWPDIKAHLALSPGEAWSQRLTPEAEVAEHAELCAIRDSVVAEIASTLLAIPGASSRKP